MKQRVADYIAEFLVSHNITDIFTVGGLVSGMADEIIDRMIEVVREGVNNECK